MHITITCGTKADVQHILDTLANEGLESNLDTFEVKVVDETPDAEELPKIMTELARKLEVKLIHKSWEELAKAIVEKFEALEYKWKSAKEPPETDEDILMCWINQRGKAHYAAGNYRDGKWCHEDNMFSDPYFWKPIGGEKFKHATEAKKETLGTQLDCEA